MLGRRWSSDRAYFCGEPGPLAVNKWDVLKLKLRTPAVQEISSWQRHE